MATKTLGLTALGTGGLPLVLESALGSTVGKILLVDVAFAMFICTLAIQTAAIRLTFSMARDHRLPFGERLAHVTEQRHSPVTPAIVSGVIAIAILVVNIGNAQIFLIVTSVSIVIVYLAYLLVTVPVLLRRLAGWPAEGKGSGLFTMRRPVGLAVNLIAVGYGALMAINLIWPRTAIYGAGGYAWGGVISIAAIVGIGLLYYLVAQRRRDHTVAAEHQVTSVPADILTATSD